MDLREVCRTCLKSNNTILPHFELDECVAPGKTYVQLLNEYSQIKFNNNHETKMPQGICALCCSELRRIYIFITHAQECNKKMMNMLRIDLDLVSEEDGINKQDNEEGENTELCKEHSSLTEMPQCTNIKNEPIDDLLKTIGQDALGEISGSDVDIIDTCLESVEGNIKMEFDTTSSISCTNHTLANETQHSIEETQKYIIENITILRENQEKMLSILNRCSDPITSSKMALFPIKNDKELRYANDYAKDNFNECVNILKQIIPPEGLHRSFHRLFTNDITMNYNYNGIQNKKCFKEFKHLHRAIYESTAKEGYTFDEYVKDVRVAMKLCKNRLFKKKHDLNKKLIQLNIPLR